MNKYIIIRDRHHQYNDNDVVVHNFLIDTIVEVENYSKERSFTAIGKIGNINEQCQIIHYNDIKPFAEINFNIKLL